MLALVGAAAVLAGCGGSKASEPAQFPDRGPGLARPIQTADCTDWRRANAEQRRRTVVELRKFLGGPVGSSQGIQNGPVLDDPKAYKLLESYCRNYFARGFKLYKLYDRAAAFVGHPPR